MEKELIGRKQIFIGGSGRCGTSILASLFGVHPDVLYFAEPRFLTDRGGLNDLVNHRIDLEDFRHNMLRTFQPVLVNGLAGLGYREAPDVYTTDEIERLIDDRLSGEDPLPVRAARFVDGLFSLGFPVWRKKFWVEKTPHNVLMADTLHAMFPEMKYFHILRDPKDVCASMMVQSWGPDSPEEFIFYYNQLMRGALEARSGIPAENYFVISLETLIAEPAGSIRAIFDFAGIGSTEELDRRWLDMVDLRTANTGRWKSELSATDAAAIERYCYPMYREWKSAEAQISKAVGF